MNRNKGENNLTKKLNNIKQGRITRRMKKILNSLKARESRKADKCPICLEQYDNMSASLPCNHVYCLKCLANWSCTNNTCPFCRKTFTKVEDNNGEIISIDDLVEKWAEEHPENSETLKCEECWTEIVDDEMQICHDCRCVYVHFSCFADIGGDRRRKWLCDDCINKYEEYHEEEEEEEEEQKQESFYYFDTQLQYSSQSLNLRKRK